GRWSARPGRLWPRRSRWDPPGHGRVRPDDRLAPGGRGSLADRAGGSWPGWPLSARRDELVRDPGADRVPDAAVDGELIVFAAGRLRGIRARPVSAPLAG